MRTTILVILVAVVAAGAEPEAPSGLSGRVVDADGAPVAGATVELLVRVWVDQGLPAGASVDPPAPSATTETDEEGRFTLPLAPGRRGTLRVRKAGSEPIHSILALAGDRFELRIAGKGEIAARVVDVDGAPVAGAQVRAWGPTDATDRRTLFGSTDEKGRVVLSGAPPGFYEVEAEANGYGSPETRNRKVWVPSGGSTSAEILLLPAREIRGIVRDAATKRPVEGAEVGWAVGLRDPVVTGADGTFRLEGSAAAYAGTVYARAPGYALGSAPATSSPVIDLAPGFAVTGRVVSSVGEPVPGAPIAAATPWKPTDRQADVVFGTTRPDGGFRLEGLRRGLPHHLLVRAPGHGRVSVGFEVPGEGAAPVDLGEVRLPSAHTLAGIVVSTDGEPLLGSTLHLSSGSDVRELSVDGSARFRITDLPPGELDLQTNAPGAPPVMSRVVISEDEPETELVVTLPGTKSLHVTVRDPEGRPVPAVRLTMLGMFRRRHQLAMVWTDASGCATFHCLPETEYDLSVDGSSLRDDLPPLRVPPGRSVTPSGQDVEIRLLSAVPTEILALDPDGKPLPYHQLAVTYPDGSEYWAQTDWRGRATVLADPDGTFDVEIADFRIPIDAEGLPDPMAATDREKTVPKVKGRLEGVHTGAEGVVLRTEWKK